MPLILIVCFGAITVGLLEDDFTFIDSIYFSAVTVTTVGKFIDDKKVDGSYPYCVYSKYLRCD